MGNASDNQYPVISHGLHALFRMQTSWKPFEINCGLERTRFSSPPLAHDICRVSPSAHALSKHMLQSLFGCNGWSHSTLLRQGMGDGMMLRRTVCIAMYLARVIACSLSKAHAATSAAKTFSQPFGCLLASIPQCL